MFLTTEQRWKQFAKTSAMKIASWSGQDGVRVLPNAEAGRQPGPG